LCQRHDDDDEMGRGPKKHLKRLAAPKHWMMDKLTGRWAPRPSTGPHKLRECLPLVILLRNRLRYALTRQEVTQIVMQKVVKVDGKVRTDINYPTGFMDIVSIDKTNDVFRMLYDVKGRFCYHRVKDAEEAKFKLCKITRLLIGAKGVPFAVTNDARTLRYPNPDIDIGDTVKIDLATGKITGHIKSEVGTLVMITGGKNQGRVGTLEHKEKHMANFDIYHIKDAAGHTFATRGTNVFIIGKGGKPMVSLPRGAGVKRSVIDERQETLKKHVRAVA